MTAMTLTEFLLARIAEDEAVARAYEDGDNWPNPYIGDGDSSDLAWVDRFTAGRVRAECEAKRRIVELHEGAHECSTYDTEGEIDNCTWVLATDMCSTLRLLALPYADHPDYDEAWRP